MKCVESNEKLNLMLDGEAGEKESQAIQLHLENCPLCRSDLLARRTAQQLLKLQPPILPDDSFDRRMMRAFENHGKIAATPAKSVFAKWFAFTNPLAKFGLTAAVFAFGFGFAFLFGRMSVSANLNAVSSSPVKIVSARIENQKSTDQNSDRQNISPVEKEKTVVKYIKIPVIREKIVEKKIYINANSNPVPNQPIDTFANTEITRSDEKTAAQFNLKNLQPVADISYKIIRKGATNE